MNTLPQLRFPRGLRLAFLLLSAVLSIHAHAQVPNLVNYQGRVAVGTVNFDGTGQFKFALVNAAGNFTHWSNDGTSALGSEPSSAVTLTVTKGLYSVLLGDTSLTNMTAIPSTVWASADVRLRVWFDDGVNGSQLLTPDQRLAPSGYLPDAVVSSAKIAPGSIQGTNIAPGTLIPAQTIPGTTLTAAPNKSYVMAANSLSQIAFPATADFGDEVQVVSLGSGGWQAKTAPAGAAWTARDSAREWSSVASSADGSKLVAGVNNGQIYTSTDSGVTWTPRDSSRQWKAVVSSADGSKLVAGVDSGQIFTSTDSGVTWTPRDSNRPWFGVASSADGSKLAAVTFLGQIYTSTDSGVTWTPRESNRAWLSVASSADGSKLVAVVAGGQIYTSTDSGVTWTPRETNRLWQWVASSADGSKLVAVVNNGRIYTSTDSGATWNAQESTRNWSRVASSADGSQLVATVNGGQIYTSTDSGVTWTPCLGSQFWSGVASSADGNKFVAVASNEQIYTSEATFVSGATGTAQQFRHVGGGVWQPVEIPSLDASKMTTGILADARLSPNVALLDRSPQTFTGQNNFSGNVGIGTTAPSEALHVSVDQTVANYGGIRIDNTNASGAGEHTTFLDLANTAPSSLITYRLQNVGNVSGRSGNFEIFQIGGSGGGPRLTITPGGNVGIGNTDPQQALDVVGNIVATGTVTGSSDRNIKENFAPVDPGEVLERVSSMPIQRWNYIGEEVPHIGPVAQDFYGAFEVGMDDKHISMVDADGVALAAIQGLNAKLEKENAALRTQLEALKAKDRERDARLSAIEEMLRASGQRAGRSTGIH